MISNYASSTKHEPMVFQVSPIFATHSNASHSEYLNFWRGGDFPAPSYCAFKATLSEYSIVPNCKWFPAAKKLGVIIVAEDLLLFSFGIICHLLFCHRFISVWTENRRYSYVDIFGIPPQSVIINDPIPKEVATNQKKVAFTKTRPEYAFFPWRWPPVKIHVLNKPSCAPPPGSWPNQAEPSWSRSTSQMFLWYFRECWCPPILFALFQRGIRPLSLFNSPNKPCWPPCRHRLSFSVGGFQTVAGCSPAPSGDGWRPPPARSRSGPSPPGTGGFSLPFRNPQNISKGLDVCIHPPPPAPHPPHPKVSGGLFLLINN